MAQQNDNSSGFSDEYLTALLQKAEIVISKFRPHNKKRNGKGKKK